MHGLEGAPAASFRKDRMSLFAHELEALVLDLQGQVQSLEARVTSLESAATEPPAKEPETDPPTDPPVDGGDGEPSEEHSFTVSTDGG